MRATTLTAGGLVMASPAVIGGRSWLQKCAEEARREPIAIHHRVENSEIPPEFDGKKIFFISDFHLCRKKVYGQNLRRTKDFQNTLALINSAAGKQDLLVIGGDYVAYPHFDAERDLPEVQKFLAEIKKFPQKKFALFGNHEWEYRREIVEQIGEFLEAADCDVLDDESRIWRIGSAELPIFGTKDWRFGGMEISKLKNFVAEFRGQLKLILTHNPDWVEKIAGEFENSLILAGHTHGGHFSNWLIAKLALLQAKYESQLVTGRHRIRESVELLISNGAGASLPFRQNRPPDYLIVELLRSQN